MFEVITLVDGAALSHRFDEGRWQYALKSGTIDIEDKTVIEVFDLSEDESLVCTLSNVVRVGNVGANDRLMMPERVITRCPKCGFVE